MTLDPASGLVLIDFEPVKKSSESGLFLVEKARELERFGVVVDFAADVKINIERGDSVLFEDFQGTYVQINGNEFLLIDEKHILGIKETE